jgi:hypothetical protein
MIGAGCGTLLSIGGSSRMTTSLARVLLALVAPLAAVSLLSACTDTVALDDAGTACLSAEDAWWTPEPQTFEADTPITVTVVLAECLSSSCSSEREGTCDVAVTGDHIVISGHGSYVDESGPGRSCTDDCINIEATCEVPALDEGTYTVAYGDDEISLEIPSLTGAYCIPQRL